MVFQDVIRNDAGFGNHDFIGLDYIGKYPPVFIYGREYNEDLRSIVLVSDWTHFTPYQLGILNTYGKAFTDLHDREHHIRIGGNFLHIGVYQDNQEYSASVQNQYIVKRHSWHEAHYPTTFEELCSYLDEMLVYGT